MKMESAEIYNSLPEENYLVGKYHPQFLARGGDHLVYEIPEHSDVVVKASTFRIKDILAYNAEHGLPLDSLADDMRQDIQGELREKDDQSRQLRTYFGSEHTLSERRYLMKVPVTPDTLTEIFKGDWKGRTSSSYASDIDQAWTAVVVQQRAEGVDDPTHLSLNFEGFLEEDKYDDTAIKAILAQAEQDPALKDSLKEFISKAVSYAEETGNILAMAGKDNVIFYKKDDVWNYMLVDALPIHNEPVFKTAQEISKKIMNHEKITPHQQTLLMKALNFSRTINNIAEALGMSERLQIQEKE